MSHNEKKELADSLPKEKQNPRTSTRNDPKCFLHTFWQQKIVPYLVKEPSSNPQNDMSHQEQSQQRSMRELSVVFK